MTEIHEMLPYGSIGYLSYWRCPSCGRLISFNEAGPTRIIVIAEGNSNASHFGNGGLFAGEAPTTANEDGDLSAFEQFIEEMDMSGLDEGLR